MKSRIRERAVSYNAQVWKNSLFTHVHIAKGGNLRNPPCYPV